MTKAPSAKRTIQGGSGTGTFAQAGISAVVNAGADNDAVAADAEGRGGVRGQVSAGSAEHEVREAVGRPPAF